MSSAVCCAAADALLQAGLDCRHDYDLPTAVCWFAPWIVCWLNYCATKCTLWQQQQQQLAELHRLLAGLTCVWLLASCYEQPNRKLAVMAVAAQHACLSAFGVAVEHAEGAVDESSEHQLSQQCTFSHLGSESAMQQLCAALLMRLLAVLLCGCTCSHARQRTIPAA